ncbi:cytochrome c biogenesis protein CcsA [Candidatus Sulfidibacterium hydrothermale]|uniref:cytochrome c biogenesis protein CcsA n=1 Tax=Candidatus Sulfidibacterium hydrothermale TaxID=2875962 RepID=UPI001F0A2E49|nr:cytochrome c biogenesis protein CcsA [Candidatus Sulfidibacterium hydrothermale]UBM61200.1 cytochrome c biogenesis protein CcsA [Candidatus Sulfidibacterium hydrothermale]
MKKIFDILFSMTAMGILLMIFAIGIGAATFIENDFGTMAAKALVYNATWFDILLGILALNLIVNIFRHRMYRKGKFTLFLFHLAFLIILLGAAITRFISFEGMMHLREGETSHTILSDRTYVEVTAQAGKDKVQTRKHVLISVLTPHAYHQTLRIGDKKLELKAVKFIHNAREIITESTTGKPIITLVAATTTRPRTRFYLRQGEKQNIDGYEITFNQSGQPGAIQIQLQNHQMTITAPDTIRSTSMETGDVEKLAPGKPYPFTRGKLFSIKGLNLVLTQFYAHGKISYVPYHNKNVSLMDVLVVKAESGNQTREIMLKGGKGYRGEVKNFTINGIRVKMDYGAAEIQLPFSIELKDFELKRYPGSMSPSSYASRVVVIDKERNVRMPYHIYMNHVLNYRGYRFFQSSYDRDEKGSILSVNHDYWGTLFTYIGYFLMALGMFLSLINKNTRFAHLGKYLRHLSGTAKTILFFIALALFFPAVSQAQTHYLSPDKIPVINKAEADQFGHLLVQSNDGRIKPVNTLAGEVLRKLAWKSSFDGLNPDQVLLGMMAYPQYWQQVPLILVRDKELAKYIGIKGKYASYLDFIDRQNNRYKLQKLVSDVYAKSPSQRGMFDKEVMKVDERMNIAYMIYTGQLLRMVPDPKNPYHPWYSPASKPTTLSGKDSLMVVSVIPEYLQALVKGENKMADELLKQLAAYQKKYGAPLIPSQRKIDAEILYNKWMIFFRLALAYSLIGFIMIIITFVAIFKNTKFIRGLLNFFVFLIGIGFLFQTFGLGLRWYISGHAPWSDGYESMIYIGWVTMLAGLLFSKRSKMTVAATTLLASIILFVAHLSWMDPEITNLVPVLKSYWLTIHVSVITASYGFLALGALLGFFNLILMILKNPKNRELMDLHIGELTAINERTLIVGLYLLTIGTFLGGVWANESWGRYWGWDPKETWALVSVLVYSFIAHMRYIPGLRSRFAYNLAAVVGFFSILMTYFGVNYYLSGLHSYAKGDPVPIPDFVYYMLGVIILTIIWAYNNEQRLKNEKNE